MPTCARHPTPRPLCPAWAGIRSICHQRKCHGRWRRADHCPGRPSAVSRGLCSSLAHSPGPLCSGGPGGRGLSPSEAPGDACPPTRRLPGRRFTLHSRMGCARTAVALLGPPLEGWATPCSLCSFHAWPKCDCSAQKADGPTEWPCGQRQASRGRQSADRGRLQGPASPISAAPHSAAAPALGSWTACISRETCFHRGACQKLCSGAAAGVTPRS